MTQLFIKICGLSTPETVRSAIDSGADALGFVLAPGSPRFITAAAARELINDINADIETVGVFRNQPLDEVILAAHTAGFRTVQLHGSESLADRQALTEEGFRVLRAFSAPAYAELTPAERQAWSTERILIDAPDPGAGVTIDPRVLRNITPVGPWLLAGGLNPENVSELVRNYAPGGVDVSSGVESSRGIKDPTRIRDFIAAARG